MNTTIMYSFPNDLKYRYMSFNTYQQNPFIHAQHIWEKLTRMLKHYFLCWPTTRRPPHQFGLQIISFGIQSSPTLPPRLDNLRCDRIYTRYRGWCIESYSWNVWPNNDHIMFEMFDQIIQVNSKIILLLWDYVRPIEVHNKLGLHLHFSFNTLTCKANKRSHI